MLSVVSKLGKKIKKRKEKKKKRKKNLDFVIRDNSTDNDRSAGKSRVATRRALLDFRPFLLRAPKTSGWLDPSPSCTTVHDVGGGYFCYQFLCYSASSTDYEALTSCEETEQLLGLLCYFLQLATWAHGERLSRPRDLQLQPHQHYLQTAEAIEVAVAT
jgi:hypothetical protein